MSLNSLIAFMRFSLTAIRNGRYTGNFQVRDCCDELVQKRLDLRQGLVPPLTMSPVQVTQMLLGEETGRKTVERRKDGFGKDLQAMRSAVYC
jgi:hypothetical protein